ncbi:hypothetical protein [Pseudobacteriovorax antillogorgiicola]|uniref:Uncharacterized protein n=1 Tax=Pseudobacteriovorax antillogorgiicola TaxID=1513793 RepID=A0A1Y6C237_9BACT|nr:hypothetical protein [Pseudobacteriovorax antillogorgiicola]TCS50766.1 hypothetical protein EDD56_112149 [Pseudobacteriovorax antillogorgiicola]SMF41247.1 hypothetical protein SAMN06296036_112148 [Pseudobacteriovorax antillogorgiicola]
MILKKLNVHLVTLKKGRLTELDRFRFGLLYTGQLLLVGFMVFDSDPYSYEADLRLIVKLVLPSLVLLSFVSCFAINGANRGTDFLIRYVVVASIAILNLGMLLSPLVLLIGGVGDQFSDLSFWSLDRYSFLLGILAALLYLVMTIRTFKWLNQ